MHCRVATLDDSGNGMVGVPPCRYFGTPDAADITTITNLNRALTQDFLLQDTSQVVSGDVVITGTPNADIRLFLDF